MELAGIGVGNKFEARIADTIRRSVNQSLVV